MPKIKVAITGGIGSGKSLAAKFLCEQNYPVFSCDEIYKDVIQSNEYLSQMKDCFPSVIIDGRVDRAALSKVVFNNEKERERLNKIAHPMIMKKLLQYMDEAEGGIVFAEVPLLFEGNFENLFDKVIYIFRDRQLRIESVIKRDGLSVEEIEKRIQSQFSPDSEEGKNRLNQNKIACIENNSSIDELKNKIFSYLKQNVKQ